MGPSLLLGKRLERGHDLPTYKQLVNGRASDSKAHLTHAMSQATLKPHEYGPQEAGILLSSSIPLSARGRRRGRRVKPPAVMGLAGPVLTRPWGEREAPVPSPRTGTRGRAGTPYSHRVGGKVLVPYSLLWHQPSRGVGRPATTWCVWKSLLPSRPVCWGCRRRAGCLSSEGSVWWGCLLLRPG